MMKKLKLSKKAVAVTAAAALFLGGGAAFAYWTFGGTGTGSAKVAANPTSGIVVSQTAITNLAPGMRVDLAGLLTNPNVTDVKVGTLTAAISVPAGVAASDFSLAGNPQVINQVVKLGAPLTWAGMSLAYANSAVNQDNAKSVPVTLTYTLTPFVEPPPVVPAAVTLVGGLLTVSYSNPAFNGTFYSACVGDGTFTTVGTLQFPNRECLSGQFNSGVFNGTLQVTAFPVTPGTSYTFGIYPLGFNTTAVYTLPVIAA